MSVEVKSAGSESAYRTDQHKSSDRGIMADNTMSNQNAKREFADRSADTARDVAHLAKDAGDSLMDKASDMGHSMQKTAHNITEKTKHTHHAISEFTKDNPTAAVLMAFGIGAILARILPGR